MKIQNIILTVFTATLLSSSHAFASAGCEASSWNPELYSFYGAKTNIVEKISNIPAKLSERRVFVQIAQGDSSAAVRLFEKQKDGTFNVTEWTTKDSADLIAEIDKAILANKGVYCVGEQVKGVLGRLKNGKVSNSVPAPESPAAAFAHPVKEASGEFIKSTIIILC